ncbi:MAG TPA: dephospho-CoA kinase [Dehalococcoidia bacterium]|nr:dephospho-CoA kinase [Dehalococcoidia bacterium]
MLTIGLTGSIASGKSEVARILRSLGAYVVDADRVAHGVYEPGSEGYDALVRTFGSAILDAQGAIDRRQLGAIVFADERKRRQLTDIVWPLTRRAVERLAAEQEAAGTGVFVVEAPLLMEAGWHTLFDQVWLVRTSPENARRRLAQRGLQPEDIEARLAAATDPAVAEAAAHLVIDNNGDVAALERNVTAAWEAVTSRGV